MKRVFICFPLGNDVENLIIQIKRYVLYALKCGMAPVVPHFYIWVFHHKEPDEWENAKQAGKSLLWVCDEIWVFGEQMTREMEQEICISKNLNLPIKYIGEDDVDHRLGKR